MEADLMHHDNQEDGAEEEDYVLLDLDAVFAQVDISPDTPYVLSGLDTAEPILIIDDKVKLIGKYEDTIGTCFVFSENAMVHQENWMIPEGGFDICYCNSAEAAPLILEETGPSEANLFAGRCIVDPNQTPAKEVKPVAQLQKILKFRLLMDEDVQDVNMESKT